ncbi:MAG: ImmA/IrrE family metallo-endopeptidase [Rhodospirillaceae bacterium]|nr:ImmA/IrrE family metallo-endopeptidase [Rhodospirillaceae bacterium]
MSWYLLPLFEWLAKNWVSLLHEERFAWLENSAVPAATAAFLRLRRLIGASDDESQAEYAKARAWWQRHALRAADSSALYPDIFFRRFEDNIEISWTARQPVHAPDGFRFASTPGVATLPVPDVAGPLWEALAWVGATFAFHKDLTDDDRQDLSHLERIISDLRDVPISELEAVYLPQGLSSPVPQITPSWGEGVKMTDVPAVERLNDAVLMFGGVSPDIDSRDAEALLAFLTAHAGGAEDAALTKLVDTHVGAPVAAPYDEGYDLAEELLDVVSDSKGGDFIDVREIISGLGIDIREEGLSTDTIRGAAVAGENYAPAILINTTSQYNRTEGGKRFTLAHELFHVLYDRSRARRVSHTSGPWALPGVEKRANAFAAMLLMPRSFVLRAIGGSQPSVEKLSLVAQHLQVGVSALIEHLYNINAIDEVTRGRLRGETGRSPA